LLFINVEIKSSADHSFILAQKKRGILHAALFH